ncbi:hypothetical protein llg_02800 [Luteolibacter sp. LG18]|nr:hypothetical protein llg_02800 [Luteolibacter sp. LG18]
MLAHIRAEDRPALWDGVAWTGQNPAALLSKKLGDEVTLDMGNGTALKGKVIVKNDAGDGSRVVGVTFSKPAATLHVRVESNGALFADLMPEDSLSAYRWSGTVSAPVFARLPKTSVLCSSVEDKDQKDGSLVQGMPLAPAAAPAGASNAVAAADVVIPKLNSRSGAKGCIYLDLDGQTTTGTRWNTTSGRTTIVSPATPFSADVITSIWKIVSEDFAPFSINVTTDESVYNTYAKNRRKRVIFTPDQSWLGVLAGGVAFLNSFGDGSDDPCWVFNTTEYAAALAASHECGHTLGLDHDGLDDAEYYGTGNGVWGPIMGAPYGNPIVQFSDGDYPGATNFEDDLTIIASDQNGVGYVTDDVGDTPATASSFTKNSTGGISVTGLITTNTDIDYYVFSTTGGNCQFTVKDPASSPNLNVQLTLYDANGVALTTNNPAGLLTGVIGQSLAAGTYRLAVEGGAEGTYDTGGYSKYGSLGPYSIVGVVPGLGAGAASITSPTVDAVSIREGHGVYLAATAPGQTATSTIGWSQIAGPTGGVTTFSAPTAVTTRASFNVTGIYTLQFKITTNGVASMDTVRVAVEAEGGPRNFTNLGPVLTLTSPSEVYSLSANVSGGVTDDGVPTSITPSLRWELGSGAAKILNPGSTTTPVEFLAPGITKLVISATDGQVKTFREVPINVAVRKVSSAVAGTAAKFVVPTSGALGNTWVAPGFDDSGWNAGPLALGYNTRSLYKTDLLGGTDIKSLLYNKGTNVFVRVPFNVRATDYVTGMRLRMKYDDAFVLYLNGTEVVRRNAPAGIPVWNSVATKKRTASEIATVLDVDLLPYQSLLVDGTNVIAIQGINSRKNDADFLLAPQFELQLADTPYYRQIVDNPAHPVALALLGPTADADSDTFSNLVEHALGLDPFVVTPGPVGLVADGAGAVKLTLPINPPNDIKYVFERSYDGVLWTPIASKTGTGAWVSDTVTVSTVSIASPLTTIRLVEPGAATSTMYRMRYVLLGPSL